MSRRVVASADDLRDWLEWLARERPEAAPKILTDTGRAVVAVELLRDEQAVYVRLVAEAWGGSKGSGRFAVHADPRTGPAPRAHPSSRSNCSRTAA